MNRCRDCRKIKTDECPFPFNTNERDTSCQVFKLAERKAWFRARRASAQLQAEEADRLSLAGTPVNGWCDDCPRGAICPTEVMSVVANLGYKPPCRKLAQTEHAEIKAWLEAEFMERLDESLRQINRKTDNDLGGIGCKVDARVPDGGRTFDTGATRDTEEGKNDYEGFLSPLVIEAFGDYMTRHSVQSGNLRDSDNWQKGIPKSAYMKSLWRHLVDLWKEHRGLPSRDGIDEALGGLLFNVMGYWHEHLKRREGVTPADETHKDAFWGES